METKIKEVQDYFKNKVLSGEFEIKEVEEYTLVLKIDSKYEFTIWNGNVNITTTRKNYTGALSYMDLQLSDDEAKQLHNLLLPTINKFRKEILLEQKRKELEQLKKECDEN